MQRSLGIDLRGDIVLSRMTTMDQRSDRTAVSREQQRIQKRIDEGAPLGETLEDLIRFVESLTPSGMIGSILVLAEDGRHLRHGAGPSLPDEYNQAIDGIEIGPDVGSCGTAAFHNKTVSVFDIANNQLWANFKDLALRHGLRACWSTPIRDQEGKVLGTFANYYRVVRDPSPMDVELTEIITKTAAKAIAKQK